MRRVNEFSVYSPTFQIKYAKTYNITYKEWNKSIFFNTQMKLLLNIG